MGTWAIKIIKPVMFVLCGVAFFFVLPFAFLEDVLRGWKQDKLANIIKKSLDIYLKPFEWMWDKLGYEKI